MGETAVKRKSLSDVVKDNPLLVIGIVISVVFILMPSYDHQNIALWINGTSYLNNTNKFFQSSPWPGGFFFLSLFIPIQFAYTLSGYSIYVTVIVLKIILFAFTLFTGFLLYRMTNSYNPKIGKFVLAFTILNPGIIYVNYVWAQLDIFPAFFLTLFVYLYFYRFPDRSSFKQTFISLIPLFIVVFSFYFSIILVPTLLIYSARKKHALNVILVSIFLGTTFLLSQVLLFKALNYDYVDSLVSSGTGIYFMGLQRIIPISSELLITIFIILSFLLPVATRVVRLPATVSMFILLLLLLYASRTAAPNNYLWLYPFSIIGVLETYLSSTRKRFFLITNSFLWVGIVFFNLYIGTGFQAGIFYFMYDVFHRNILFIHNYSQGLTSTLIFFIALTLSLIASISLFVVPVITGRKGKEDKGEKRIESLSTIRSLYEHPKRTRTTILVVISSLVILSLMFNFLAPVYTNTSEINSAPVYTFGSQFFNGVVAWPIDGLTYSIRGSEVNYYNNGNVILLNRNLSQEYINMTVSEQVNSSVDETVPLFITPIFNVSEGYFNVVENIENDVVNPVSWVGVKNVTYSGNILSEPPIDVHQMSIGSQIEYNSSSFVSNTYYLFAYKMFRAISPSSSFNQTVLFTIKNKFGEMNSVFYNSSGLISYVYDGQGGSFPIYTNNNSFQGWNYIWFYFTGKALIMDINGYNATVNGNFIGNDSHFFLGNIDKTHSFTGLISDLYAEKSVNVLKRKVISVEEGGGNVTTLHAGDFVLLTVSSNHSGTSLAVNGKRFSYEEPLDSVQFGKPSNEKYGLSIRFVYLTIVPRNDNGFYGVADFLAFIFPYLFVYWIIAPDVINNDKRPGKVNI